MCNCWFTALRPGHFSPKTLSNPEHTKHLLEWTFVHQTEDSTSASSDRRVLAPRSALHFDIPTMKPRQKTSAVPWTTATACICQGYECSEAEQRDLHLLCPVCSLEAWRQVAPRHEQNYVFCHPETRQPMLRDALNKELRRALHVALDWLSEPEREAVIEQLSLKSVRSGAATEVVTAGNSGFVAAAFLGHKDPAVTRKYYHKSGDSERLQLVDSLKESLL